MKIKKDMLIGEVISKYPKIVKIFLKHGLGCIGCGMAQLETIEQGAKAHGIDIKNLIDDLNKSLKK